MSTVLVTGGAGFIGSHLVERLLAEPATRVVVVDNLSTGFRRNVPSDERVTFVAGDVNRHGTLAAVFARQRIDYVFHLAAVVGVDRTQADPAAVLADEHGLRHMLDLAVQHHVRHVYFASSSEVYGAARAFPLREGDSPAEAGHPYAWVKRQGERLLAAYGRAHGLAGTAFRLFNAYGPRQRTDFVVARFIRQALASAPLTVDFDGRQCRTFCHVEDTVAALAHIHATRAYQHPVVNVGSEEEISMLELARLVKKLARSASSIICGQPHRTWDIPRRVPDLARLRSIYAREARPLRQGLAEVIAAWPHAAVPAQVVTAPSRTAPSPCGCAPC